MLKSSPCYPNYNTWIGYFSDLDGLVIGKYRWIDGCNSDFISWGTGSPYNYGAESYGVYMQVHPGDASDGRWYNLPVSSMYLTCCGCQYSLNPSPTPTAKPTDPTPTPSSKPTIAPTFGCAIGWIYYNYKCYKFNIRSSISWSTCSTECASLDASLLCITDFSVNYWSASQIAQYAGFSWIGYSDLPSKQGYYQWVPGCSSTYSI